MNSGILSLSQLITEIKQPNKIFFQKKLKFFKAIFTARVNHYAVYYYILVHGGKCIFKFNTDDVAKILFVASKLPRKIT